MDQVFFDELELPHPKYNLDVGSGTHGVQTGKIMAGIEEILARERPGIVLVQGDSNTVLAGAGEDDRTIRGNGHQHRSRDSMPPELGAGLVQQDYIIGGGADSYDRPVCGDRQY